MSFTPPPATLTDEQFEFLRSVDSPTLANAIEPSKVRDRTVGFLGGNIKSLFPELPPMVGYALTVKLDNKPGPTASREGYWKMWQALAEMPRPSVLILKDVSAEPHRVASAGEVMSTLAQKLGAVGMVTDGGLRDLHEVRALGFQYFGKYVVVSHGNSEIVEVGTPVEIDGETINTGDIVHGDANGVVVIPASIIDALPAAVDDVRVKERQTMDFIKSAEFDLAQLMRNSGY